MKKAVKRVKRKPKIFNVSNLVLIGFLLVELLLIVDYNFTGNAIMKTIDRTMGSVSEDVREESKIIVPSEQEILENSVEQKIEEENQKIIAVEPEPVITSTCYDSDGLNSLMTFGYVEVDSEKFYDYCDGDTAYDYYCNIPSKSSNFLGNIIRMIGNAIFGKEYSSTSKNCKDFGENYFCEEGGCEERSVCTPTPEICDDLDNDCDSLIDEGGVCVGGLEIPRSGEIEERELTIEEINQKIQEQGALWVAGKTSISSLSSEEFKKRLGLLIDDYAPKRSLPSTVISSGTEQDFPDFFDWRYTNGKNHITPVKNQGGCGSCWAFATLAVLEGHTNAYYNNPSINLDMSEQDLVSCFHGEGCKGASIEQIENIFSSYLQDNGIATESCFPYTAANGDCSNKCTNWENDAWKTLGYQEVDLSGTLKERSDNLKFALMNYGPVEVGMDVYSDFRSYPGGIYSHVAGNLEGYHAVTIVGFGVSEEGVEYWIIKNSWGTGWGEDGYFRIMVGEARIDERFAYVITEPMSPVVEETICEDLDSDGYCYWGLGSKPLEGCPECDNIIYDCDDSKGNIFEGCGKANFLFGSVSITSNPSGAKVYIRDSNLDFWAYRGTTPLETRLGTGTREIKVTQKLCYEEAYANVDIIENQFSNVHINLSRGERCLPGWPVELGMPISSFNPPILYDLDKDGMQEVILASDKLYVFNGEGDLIQQESFSEEGMYAGSPVIGDINGDGYEDIVVIAYIPGDTQLKEIYVWNFGGGFVEGFPLVISEEGRMGRVSLSDIDLDGKDEILTYVSDYNISNRGTNFYVAELEQGINLFHDFVEYDTVYSYHTYYTIGNLDEDDYLEFLITSPNNLYIFNYDELTKEYKRNIFAGLPYDTRISLVLADVNNDGSLEVFTDSLGGQTSTYAFYSNGSRLPGWPNPCVGISIGDVDKDGFGEIFCGADVSFADIDIIFGRPAYEHDGTMLWRKFNSRTHWAPSIGDINGDGEIDIIIADRGGEILAWDKSGNELEGFPLEYAEAESQIGVIALGEINGDGKLDVIIGSPDDSNMVYALNFGGDYNPSTLHWPMIAHDAQHTGCYDCDKEEPTLPKLSCSPGQIIGDVNGNGEITMLDAQMVAGLVRGEFLAPDNICCMDMNKDTVVNETDAIIIANIVGGVSVSPGKCGDCGTTPNGQCSGYKYCYNGQLAGNCDRCGCPDGGMCKNGICKYDLEEESTNELAVGGRDLGGGSGEVAEKTSQEQIQETQPNIVERIVGAILGIFGIGEKELEETEFEEGQQVELTGDLEIITWDDFENKKSGEIYYLNVDGKRYELKLKNPQPILYKSEVSIKGVLTEDKIIVDSIEPVKGYGQTALGGEDNWTGILGEQKYAVISLSYVNETFPLDPWGNVINVSNYTEHLFFGANQWVITTSYNKASLRGEYFGEYIVPNDYPPTFFHNYAVSMIENKTNLSNYDGIIVFFPEGSLSFSGGAVFGKKSFNTHSGEIFLYNIYLSKHVMFLDNMEPSYGVLVHEMGHNFGMGESILLYCNPYPNRPQIGLDCIYSIYGDPFDVMGWATYLESYGSRNNLIVTKWINVSNIPEVEEGVFFISPYSTMFYPNEIIGLKIPIRWDVNKMVIHAAMNPYSYETLFDEHMTHYYLEYRTRFNWQYNSQTSWYKDENLSGQGLIIRLGADSLYLYDDNNPFFYITHTYLLNSHPNVPGCPNNPNCLESPSWNYNVWTPLFKNETYYDSLNNMSISVLDMNESGALVEIKKWYGKLSCFLGQLIGDVNGNGEITMLDAQMVAGLVRGEFLAPDNICCMDMNKDTVVNETDAIIIANIVGGVSVSPGKCGDCGTTPNGQCSGYKYCYNGQLAGNCDKCGCPDGGRCKNGICKYDLEEESTDELAVGDRDLGGESDGGELGGADSETSPDSNEEDDVITQPNIFQRFISGVGKVIQDIF